MEKILAYKYYKYRNFHIQFINPYSLQKLAPHGLTFITFSTISISQMTIEATLPILFGGENYLLMVKMITIDRRRYFFIGDTESGRNLFDGKILELTWTDGKFSLTNIRGELRSPGIPENIISAIIDEILKNRKTWSF